MSSTCPVLPNEICFSIIDYVAEDKETSDAILKASSLVNRDFASFCQRHIFRQITVGVCGPLTSKRKALVQTLTQSPHLARFVQEVCYVLGTEGSTEPYGGVERANDDYSLTLWEFLPSINSVNIQHKISRCYIDPSYPHPPCPGCQLGSDALEELKSSHGSATTSLSMDSHKGTSLATILEFPQLTDLTLLGCALVKTWPKIDSHRQVAAPTRKLLIKRLVLDNDRNIPVDLLDYLGELEYFRAGGYNMTYSNKQDPKKYLQPRFQITMPYAKLREVDIQDIDLITTLCRRATEFHSRTNPFPTLRCLNVKTVRRGPNKFKGVVWSWTEDFFRLATHLEEIALLDASPENVREMPNLALCFQNCSQTLRRIKLHDRVMLLGSHGAVEDNTVNSNSFVQVIHDAFSSVQGQNVIEVLDLTIHFENAEILVNTRRIPFFHHWQRLDAVLMEDRSTNFPHLHSVRITLDFEMDRGAGGGQAGRDAALRDIMREPLQRLYSTSELVFECHIEYSL